MVNTSMSKHPHSIKVPHKMQSYYQAAVELTNAFSKTYLDEDYCQLSQYAVAALCRKKPSPLLSGRLNTWVAAIIHALGTINFLFDASKSPYVSVTQIAEEFGLSKSTVANKSRQIRDMLKMRRFDHRWCLPSQLHNNSLVWMITYNGFIVDARRLEPGIQEIAYEKGLIPYIHAYEGQK